MDGAGGRFYISGMDTRCEAIGVGCGGPGSAALYWLSRALGLSVPGLAGVSAFPIEPFRIPRSSVADRAFEKTFHA